MIAGDMVGADLLAAARHLLEALIEDTKIYDEGIMGDLWVL
jgi:hypothetical protein